MATADSTITCVPLPAVVTEALAHLRSYAGGGHRCRWERGGPEVVEYVPRRATALELLDELTAALQRGPDDGAADRSRALRLAG